MLAAHLVKRHCIKPARTTRPALKHLYSATHRVRTCLFAGFTSAIHDLKNKKQELRKNNDIRLAKQIVAARRFVRH